MEIIFKRGTIDDVPEMIALCNEVFEEQTSIEFATKIFNDTKSDPNNIYINGFIDGKLIAHTKVTLIPTMYEEMNTYAIINHFCVKQKYRRHHIGIKMLEIVTKVCKDRNCTSLKLWSKNIRVPAHSCYKQFGFELLDAGFFEKEI